SRYERAEFMLPLTTGARPGKRNMISRPNSAISRLFPERNPSPTPTNSSNEPTPQAMPNMVRNDRSLYAHRLRKICANRSSIARLYLFAVLDVPRSRPVPLKCVPAHFDRSPPVTTACETILFVSCPRVANPPTPSSGGKPRLLASPRCAGGLPLEFWPPS